MTSRLPFRLSIIAFASLILASSAPAQAGSVGRIVDETVEHLARRAARETTERLTVKFGDDAVRLMLRDGGPELLECIAVHGDEVMEFALKASPEGRRVLANCATDLLPHMRRVGVAALELEAKAPGLATKFFRVFGDETAVALARSVPREDLPRLLRMAESADSPTTRDLLVRGYAERGAALLDKIPAKLVMATGLSAAMVLVALETTAPFRSIANSIDNNPDLAKDAVKEFVHSSTTAFSLVAVILIAVTGAFIYFGVRRVTKRRDA